MAIGVDTSNWKPRKLKGTPALKTATLLGIGIIGFGVTWGAFLQFSSFLERPRKNFEKLYEDPIEEIERRQLIGSGLPLRTGDQIRKQIIESQRIDLPGK